MIILISGASHTGKTLLAQKLLEKYKYPYLSIDHLKMGLIRSGQTDLTPMSEDSELTEYLWPIVREMIKTAVENGQNLIVEGCYIPFDWQKDFEDEYLACIRAYCLVMSESYILNHFDDIRKYANVIENRLDDEYCTPESVLRDNLQTLAMAREHNADILFIDDRYEVEISSGLPEASSRTESFENMLSDLKMQAEHEQMEMDRLKQSGKEKTATYRQYLGNRMLYRMMLEKYKQYGLLE